LSFTRSLLTRQLFSKVVLADHLSLAARTERMGRRSIFDWAKMDQRPFKGGVKSASLAMT